MLARTRRFLVAVATLGLKVGAVRAATIVVDTACPTPGNGTGGYTATCDATAAGNPRTTFTAAIGGVSTGDTIEMRGIHAAHGSCPGDSIGADYTDIHLISGKTNITVQPYGYTGPGTGEVAFGDGTTDVTWTQCTWDGTLCDCGPSTLDQTMPGATAGARQTACTETWWYTGSGTSNKAFGAEKPDGSPTYRVRTVAEMTNAHSGYVSTACHSPYAWMRCNTANDCPGVACDATSAEIDSSGAQTAGSDLLVRWAATPDATNRVFYNSTGSHYYVANSSGITIQGFNFRCHAAEAISFADSSGPCVNCTATDNRVYYSGYSFLGGADYGIATRLSSPVTISGNNIGYTTSEGIHARNKAVGPTVMLLYNNWIHDVGDQNVLGPGSAGTPSGMIITTDHSGSDGNWDGSEVYGNVLQRMHNANSVGGSNGRGIVLEDTVSNLKIHDNVITGNDNECIGFSSTAASSSNNEVYNNLCHDSGSNYGSGGDEGAAIFISVDGGVSFISNRVYNNTFYNNGKGMMDVECSGTCDGNSIKNNIAYEPSTQALITWPHADTSVFGNNVLYSATKSASDTTFSNIHGTGYSCLDTSSGCGGACALSVCADPLFVSTTNFHIQPNSPAKDIGTLVFGGIASSRTRGIYNPLSATHGETDFSTIKLNSGAPDAGADEIPSGCP